MPLKKRRRYLSIRINSNQKFNSKEILDALWSAILRLYGEYGASKTGLAIIDYDMDKGLAIIRVAHTEVEKVRAGIATITEIAATPTAMHVLTVSGTLRALNRKLETHVNSN